MSDSIGRSPRGRAASLCLALLPVLLAACNQTPASAARKKAEANNTTAPEKGLDLPSFSATGKLEIEKEAYPGGEPRVERSVRKEPDGKVILHGKETIWHRNGQKQSEGEFNLGQKNGRWVEWDEKGQILSDVSYRDGKKDGRWTTWSPDGKLQKEEDYRNDSKRSIRLFARDPAGAYNIRTGEWQEWHGNGRRKSAEQYVDNVEDGVWTTWHESSTKGEQKADERTFKLGKPDGQ